jgi:glutamine synthetase
MTVLNTIVAKQLKVFKKEVDRLIEEKGIKKDDAIFNILREYIKQTKNILFEGDGYSEEWAIEAKNRGLSNNKNTPLALEVRIAVDTISLFNEMNVMNKIEIEARYEIELEEYVKKIQIEGRVLADMAKNHIIPTAISYQNTLIENVRGLKEIFGKDFEKYSEEQLSLIKEISDHISSVSIAVENMTEERKSANHTNSLYLKAQDYCNKVKPYFDEIRSHCDKLELLVDNELWPLPKYREMFFIK